MLLTLQAGSRSSWLPGSKSNWMARRSSPLCPPSCASPSSRHRAVSLLSLCLPDNTHGSTRVRIYNNYIPFLLQLSTNRPPCNLTMTRTAHLERVGIAWPNPSMFEKPLHSDPNLARNGAGGSQGLNNTAHRCTYSNDSTTASSPMHGLPMPPPPTPALGHYDFHSLQAASMQGYHNAIVNGPASDTISGHELQNPFGSMPLSSLHDSHRGQRTQLEIRLPSDQLQKLIFAMSPSKQAETNLTGYTQMPPPPLPLHALVAKAGETDPAAHEGLKDADPTLVAPNGSGLYTSRGSSDVSMHTGCAYFPICTSEDDSSLVVHGNPACPSANVKGRKEGSSPVKRMSSIHFSRLRWFD